MVVVGSGDLREKVSIMEERTSNKFEEGRKVGTYWRGEKVGRRQLRNTSGRDEEKEKGEDKKHAWKDGREEEVREYIVKKSEGR